MPATLLLADDSVTIQRVMALTFDGEDVRVISVGDGEQAIRRIDADAPDIVLADVSMPKVDGYGVASHIKQSPALSHIPVLLLTGAFDPIDEAKAAACGCDGVLVKPFEPRALVSRVAELLASRPPRSAVPVAPHPALQVVPVASVPPPGPVATLAPRSVRVPPPPGVDDRAAAEFARDMDDLRRAIVSTPANEQAWDPVVRPDGPPATAGLAHEFDFGTAALDVVRRDENRPAPRAETPHQPAGASSPRQAPPEWEAELLREPVAPSPESAVSAPDFGDWDLPARPVPMVHPDDGELLTTPSGGERIELREPARATPVAPAPPAPAVPPPLLPAAPVMSIAPLREVPAQMAISVEPSAGAPQPRPPSPASAVVPPAPRPSGAVARDVSIGRAFAALLAAEQQQPAYRPAGNTAIVSDAVIDEVVRRVVARLSDDAVQRLVLDTAERLVREEINRIKENPD